MQFPACGKDRDKILQRRVKRKIRVHDYPAVFALPGVFPVEMCKVRERPVRNHGAFGKSCGSGGIDHICKRVRRGPADKCIRCPAPEGIRYHLLVHDKLCIGILDHVADTILGIFRGDRNVGRACFLNPEHCQNEFLHSVHLDGYEIIDPDSLITQPGSKLV